MKTSGKSSCCADSACRNCPYGTPITKGEYKGAHRCEWSAKLIRQKTSDPAHIARAMRASIRARRFIICDNAVLVKTCTECDYISKL